MSKKPILTMPSGERFEVVDFRPPKMGQLYLGVEGPQTATYTFTIGGRAILKPIPSPEPVGGEIKRRGEYEQPCGESSVFDPDVDDLIDAACAVVNDLAQYGSHGFINVDNLAAALDPFTEPVAPEERFYAEGVVVLDRDGGTVNGWVATCDDEQDAKDFAAYKNGANPKSGFQVPNPNTQEADQ